MNTSPLGAINNNIKDFSHIPQEKKEKGAESFCMVLTFCFSLCLFHFL